MFPQLARFTDLGLLLLRLMVAIVFISSGWADVKDPEARSKSIGLSRGLTVLLGIAELAYGLGVAFGVLTQLAAIGLILIMLGAIHRKIFVWHTGFWGERASGWHYDVFLVVMRLVILFSYVFCCVLWNYIWSVHYYMTTDVCKAGHRVAPPT